MAGPWEKYASEPEASGPWQKYSTPVEQSAPAEEPGIRIAGFRPSIINTVKGIYNAAKSGVTLPGDVYAGKTDPLSDEGIRRSLDLASVAYMPSAGRTMAVPKPATVTPELVQDAGTKGYRAAEGLGVQVAPSHVSSELTALRDRLYNNIRPDRAEQVYQGLTKEAERFAPHAPPETLTATQHIMGYKPPAKAPVELPDFQSMRQGFGDIAQLPGVTQTERSLAKQAKLGIDEILANTPQTAAVRGNPQELARILSEANANWAGSARQETIGNIIERARSRAAVGGSGLNAENLLRSEFRAFTKPNNKGVSQAMKEGFNPAEIAEINKFVESGAGNTRRWIGNLLGGGGGLGASVVSGVAHALGLPPGASLALPAAGALIKGRSNSMAEALAARLEQMGAQRSPYAQAAQAALPERMQMAPLAWPTKPLIAGSLEEGRVRRLLGRP